MSQDQSPTRSKADTQSPETAVKRSCGLSHQKHRESLTGVQFDPFENPSESLTKPQFDPFENPSESLTKLQIDPFSKLWESLTERNPSESLTIPEPTPQRKASRFEHATRNRSPFAPNRVYGCEVQQLVSRYVPVLPPSKHALQKSFSVLTNALFNKQRMALCLPFFTQR